MSYLQVCVDLQGLVLEEIMVSFASEGKKKRFIYLGDGVGDFYPATKLEKDLLMPKKNFPFRDLTYNQAGPFADQGQG